MTRLFRTLVFMSIIASGPMAFSQTNGVLGTHFWDNWSLSASGGPNLFFGDIKEYRFWPATSPINEIRFAGTVSLNRQLSHVFMLRGQFFFGQLAGEKLHYKDGSPCNQYFESTLFELNLNATINFSNLILRYNPKRFFFVYGTIGAGAVDWITKKKDITTHEIIAKDGSWESINPHLVIPAGLGAYFSIKDKVNLGLEWTLRALAIDRLDATVGGFPYDSYSLLAFNITYNFNKRAPAKLNSAAYQKQIGPPPPRAVLADEIEEERKKEEMARQAEAYAKLKPPVRDTIVVKVPVEVHDTVRPPEEPFATDTVITKFQVKGITYRVQVFAYGKNIYTAQQIRERFNLEQEVVKEFSGGWYRYTIGSFTSLAAARELMYELKNNTDVKDAFVAKYINGQREGTTSPKKPVKSVKTTSTPVTPSAKTVSGSKGTIYYSKKRPNK